MSEVLYNDSYCIGIEELNKIYLSLLTSADHVYINYNVEADWQLPNSIYLHIKNSMDALHKQDLIRYWSFPYEHGLKQPDIVLNSNEYHIWDDIINKTFFNSDRLRSIYYYLSEGQTIFSNKEENTSKILLIRREYWTYALLSMLHVDKVLNYFSDWMPDYNNGQLLSEPIDDIAVRNVFSCSSSSVFALDPEDVIALHKKNKKLRNQLNQRVKELSLVHTDIIHELLHEATEANEELIKNEKWGGIENGMNLSVTLAGVGLNLTPVGFIFNQIQTAKDIGQGIYNALGALYGNNTQNLFYILIKMRNKLNRKMRRANAGHTSLFLQS